MMITEGYDRNIVQVERDWSDLNEKMEYLIANADIAQRIVENSAKAYEDRYFTLAAQPCCIRRMMAYYTNLDGTALLHHL
jgi:spore maturation protein CgeB